MSSRHSAASAIRLRRSSSWAGSLRRVSAITTSCSVPDSRSGRGERGDAARSHPFERSDEILQFMRVDVPAGPDDDVLASAGYEDVALGDVTPIAAVEPVAVEQGFGLGRIAIVARRRRRTPEFQFSLPAFGQFAPAGIDDADLVPGQGPAAGDEVKRIGIVCFGRVGDAAFRQRLPVHPVDDRCVGRSRARRRRAERPCPRRCRRGRRCR